MSVNEHPQQHDKRTRERFRSVLHDALISPETGTPEGRRYKLTDKSNSGDCTRIGVHLDAWKNSPLEPGDEVKQLYFEDLGIVILDLNPRDD